MNRKFLAKLTILIGAVMTALILTVYRSSPSGLAEFTLGEPIVRAAPGVAATASKTTYDLTALKVFNNALVKIRDNYVDPTRVNPKAMLLAALDSVQRNIPEVLVEPNADKDEVIVTVNDKAPQHFSIKDVDSPWKLSGRLKEIFRFVQANMNSGADAKQIAEIEYAAINGMLGTLDPHSSLLDPEDAKDMDIQTGGKFGGIGITIGLRKKNGVDQLTVLNLISSDTPAAKAGLKANDHIVKINDQPTADLTLNEAMSRLRGDPQTRVTVGIERAGVTGVTDYVITRDTIQVSAVKSHLLKNGVGYLKIDQFSSHVGKDLENAVAALKKQGAKAWVLDLRWDPGGLLDQAIKVVDLFVESGTIVTTVGYAGKQREEKRAKVAGTEGGPLAVLINGGSASASEIVAGALKNLNRAVIIGQTSFGKGSVQVMFDNDDGSKLKLTIAQYLTPGDVSIQSVGITPDIETVPAYIPEQLKTEKDRVRLLERKLMKESDYDAALTSKNAHKGDKPAEIVKYLFIPPKPKDDDASGANPPDLQPGDEAPLEDTFNEDWEIQFARDFVAQATTQKRPDMITQGKKYIAQARADQDKLIADALGKLGVDWTTAAKSGAPKLSATFTTDKTDNKMQGGDVVAITGTVKNDGDGTAYQVHAKADIDDFQFEDQEMVWGKIGPGETKTQTMYVKIDKDAPNRIEGINWVFDEANGAKVDATPLKVTVNGVARPQFAYTYQLIEDGGANGDGLLQIGESFKLRVTVKNVGVGKSESVTASLAPKGGTPIDGVVVNKGRFEITAGLAPNESKTLEFAFDVKKDFQNILDQYGDDDKTLKMDLTVYDATLREGLNDTLKFAVHGAEAGPDAANGKVKATRTTDVREGADDDAPVIGSLKKGGVVKSLGKLGGYTKIEIEPGRPGFVSTSSVANAGGAAVNAMAFEQVWQVTPPSLTLNTTSLETSTDHYKLSGTATDNIHVEDVFVIVSNRQAKIEGRKVFYKSNRSGKDASKLDFTADVPVSPGNNIITVVARENTQIRTIDTVYVWRTDAKSAQASK